jgi:hypothetical protein
MMSSANCADSVCPFENSRVMRAIGSLIVVRCCSV